MNAFDDAIANRRLPNSDVLQALGAMTWCSITLEDAAYGLVDHVMSTSDRQSPVTARIDTALRLLRTLHRDECIDRAIRWLELARVAIGRRNDVLHAVPLTKFEPHGEIGFRNAGTFLGRLPRGDRPYFEIPADLDTFQSIAIQILAVLDTWRDAYLGIWSHENDHAPVE